jgi:hypothetical protein
MDRITIDNGVKSRFTMSNAESLLTCATKPAPTYESRSILYVHQWVFAPRTFVRRPRPGHDTR